MEIPNGLYKNTQNQQALSEKDVSDQMDFSHVNKPQPFEHKRLWPVTVRLGRLYEKPQKPVHGG